MQEINTEIYLKKKNRQNMEEIDKYLKKKKQKLKEYQKNYCEVSSNVNEVIRPVLDFFFTIRFHKYKKALKSTKKH